MPDYRKATRSEPHSFELANGGLPTPKPSAEPIHRLVGCAPFAVVPANRTAPIRSGPASWLTALLSAVVAHCEPARPPRAPAEQDRWPYGSAMLALLTGSIRK